MGKETFKVGDSVKHASFTGPTMTITEINGDIMTCQYWDSKANKFATEKFNSAFLVNYTSGAADVANAIFNM